MNYCPISDYNFLFIFTERTYRKAPQKPPTSVKIDGLNPDTIHVNWRYVAPTIDEEPIIGFKVCKIDLTNIILK